MNIFCFNRLRYQVNDYVQYKSLKRGIYIGSEHKEWLLKFVKVTRKRDIADISIQDFEIFRVWLFEHYASDYMVRSGIHPVRCLLKFYRRYDVLRQTGKDISE